MKKLFTFSTIILLLFASCGKGNDKSDNYSEDYSEDFYSSSTDSDSGLEDGTYCADVEYYNPDAGTRSSYELDVEVENGELIQINWPNGGWLDESHFSPGDISSGEYSFTSDEGYEYTVTLGAFGGC